MAEVTTYRCDICGALKQEANHWYRGVNFERVFSLQPWEDDPANINDRSGHIHLCGLQCATKAMHKAMQE